jgi:stage II sporulation protein R
MQRGIIILIIFFTIVITASSKIGLHADQENNIPEDAIRLRIIANSNSNIDQSIKLEIRNQVVNYINPKIKDIKNQEEARKIIFDQVEGLNQVVNEVLKKHKLNTKFYVDYGLTNFPTKVYGDKVYQAGQYESVYIVLGEGKGDNFWCVLFPPLCLVDVHFSDDVATDVEDVEYSFYITEKLKDLFKHK